MSILPNCTCDAFSRGFGYSENCPRHRSAAKWWAALQERNAAKQQKLRQQALTRPVHGGYPDTTPGVDSSGGPQGEKR